MSTLDYPLELEPVAEAAYEPEQRSPAWAYWFMAFLFGFQILLLLPPFGPSRAIIRAGTYMFGLVLLVLLRGRGIKHPAASFAVAVMLILILSMANPNTNSLIAGAATITLYLATLSPLFWVPKLRINLATLHRVVFVFWAFHAVSAALGVLQVIYPERFNPFINEFVAQARERWGKNVLTIMLANGAMVLRPTGLTDTPGGAAISGMYVVLLGLGLFVQTRRRFVQILTIGGMALGMFCLYISQVRVLFLAALVAIVLFLFAYARRENMKRVMLISMLVGVIVVATFVWAVAVGGSAVTGRLGTLLEKSPTEVYSSNRGLFLRQVYEEYMWDYPLGAGLGRWGMVYRYFGDPSQPDVYCEIQWQSWVVDGGIPLLLIYPMAIIATLVLTWRIARRAQNEYLGGWGALLFAYTMASLAMTFDYPFFSAQLGMEFWFLNAILFAAYIQTQQIPVLAPPEFA